MFGKVPNEIQKKMDPVQSTRKKKMNIFLKVVLRLMKMAMVPMKISFSSVFLATSPTG